MTALPPPLLAALPTPAKTMAPSNARAPRALTRFLTLSPFPRSAASEAARLNPRHPRVNEALYMRAAIRIVGILRGMKRAIFLCALVVGAVGVSATPAATSGRPSLRVLRGTDTLVVRGFG